MLLIRQLTRGALANVSDKGKYRDYHQLMFLVRQISRVSPAIFSNIFKADIESVTSLGF